MTTNKKILNSIKVNILEIIPDANIFLFGSRARKDNKADSDWDLLILSGQTINIDKKTEVRKKLFFNELENNISINSLIFNDSEWNNKYKNYPLYFEIQKEGKLL
jgi:predicted nucleotidyltransferase